MTLEEHKAQLERKIEINRAKYAQAAKHHDRGSMTLYHEIIRDCERMIRHLPAIYKLMEDMTQ